MGGSLPPTHCQFNKHVGTLTMYNYFPHPSNARTSSMVVSLLIEEGFAGYGLYWAILEVLRDAPSYKYSSDPKVWAYVLHGQDPGQIERVLRNYGLFDFDNDGLVFSPWLMEQLGAYDDTKQRRRAAGLKGAARRWGSKGSEDGNAMAMPLTENGNAMAYNITNITTEQKEINQPTPREVEGWESLLQNPGKPIDPDLPSALASTSTTGHASGYIAQVCLAYGMGENVLNFLCERTDGGDVTNPLYQKFVSLVKRIERDKFKPNQPANFFLRKLFE